MVNPWPPQKGRVGGVCFNDEEPHLEAECRHLDFHRDGTERWLSLVVEAADHYIRGLQVIHRETSPRQAPKGQDIHG